MMFERRRRRKKKKDDQLFKAKMGLHVKILFLKKSDCLDVGHFYFFYASSLDETWGFFFCRL